MNNIASLISLRWILDKLVEKDVTPGLRGRTTPVKQVVQCIIVYAEGIHSTI